MLRGPLDLIDGIVMMHRFIRLAALALLALAFAGCSPVPREVPGPAPTQTPQPTIPSETPSETPQIDSFYIQPGVPSVIADPARKTFIAAGKTESNTPQGVPTQLRVRVDGNVTQVAQWIYALVTTFPTIPDG